MSGDQKALSDKIIRDASTIPLSWFDAIVERRFQKDTLRSKNFQIEEVADAFKRLGAHLLNLWKWFFISFLLLCLSAVNIGFELNIFGIKGAGLERISGMFMPA